MASTKNKITRSREHKAARKAANLRGFLYHTPRRVVVPPPSLVKRWLAFRGLDGKKGGSGK